MVASPSRRQNSFDSRPGSPKRRRSSSCSELCSSKPLWIALVIIVPTIVNLFLVPESVFTSPQVKAKRQRLPLDTRNHTSHVRQNTSQRHFGREPSAVDDEAFHPPTRNVSPNSNTVDVLHPPPVVNQIAVKKNEQPPPWENLAPPARKHSPSNTAVGFPRPPIDQDKNVVNTQRDNRIVYFLHLHKSGGTCMCKTAGRNFRKIQKVHNCNVQPDQRCCGGDDSLAAQQDFAQKMARRYDFVANERDMYRSFDHENYRYVVTLRNSRARYKSHWKHVYRLHPSTTGAFEMWYPYQPDNWNVRKICGTDCIDNPKYQITRQSFEQTIQRLQQFDDILFLEDFDRSFAAFAKHVHWTRKPFCPPEVFNIVYPTEDVTHIWDSRMSALDDALYEMARQWFENAQQQNETKTAQLPPDLQTRLDDYFENGPLQMCQNTCCGNCSMY